jgi:hypothetical protein
MPDRTRAEVCRALSPGIEAWAQTQTLPTASGRRSVWPHEAFLQALASWRRKQPHSAIRQPRDARMPPALSPFQINGIDGVQSSLSETAARIFQRCVHYACTPPPADASSPPARPPPGGTLKIAEPSRVPELQLEAQQIHRNPVAAVAVAQNGAANAPRGAECQSVVELNRAAVDVVEAAEEEPVLATETGRLGAVPWPRRWRSPMPTTGLPSGRGRCRISPRSR